MPNSASSRPAGNGGARRWPFTKCASATGSACGRPGRATSAVGMVVLRATCVFYNALAMRDLKSDLFGSVRREESGGRTFVVRDTADARWWTAWLARRLCRREARALIRLEGLPGVPKLIASERRSLHREWIDGLPMQVARPAHADYFRAAHALLARLHRRGIAHNDLAKEPNWLVTPEG